MTPSAAPPSTAPFELPPVGRASPRGGVLLLHGFTGSPFEMRPLGERLAREGFHASGILLAGHGTDPSRLAGVRAEDWYGDAERGLEGLSVRIGGPVGVAGLSMGGLLAARLAALHPERVAALALLSVPFRAHPTWRRFVLPLATWSPIARHLTYRKGEGSDIRDPGARSANPSYREAPMTAVGEFVRVVAETRPLLSRIEAPTLLLHGRLDRTASLSDARRTAATLPPAAAARLVVLEGSGHVITVDVDRERVADEVAGFFRTPARAESRSA